MPEVWIWPIWDVERRKLLALAVSAPVKTYCPRRWGPSDCHKLWQHGPLQWKCRYPTVSEKLNWGILLGEITDTDSSVCVTLLIDISKMKKNVHQCIIHYSSLHSKSLVYSRGHTSADWLLIAAKTDQMILWQSLLYFIDIIYTSCWHRELAPADLQPVSTDDRGR